MPKNIDEELRRDLSELEIFIRKLDEGKEAVGAAPQNCISTWSTFCSVGCASSATTFCLKDVSEIAEREPELAKAFTQLHKGAVEAVGEEKLLDAFITQARVLAPKDRK